MSKPSLYDEHLERDVDHRGHQLVKNPSFVQVTPKGAESTLWKLHLSVDPGQDLGNLKRSWDIFNKVVDSDPAFISAFKVTKPDAALRLSDPSALQAGKQIIYYIPDTMKPETLERFVSTVESEFKQAGIKPGPQVKFDRAVPGSAGYSSYRSDVASPRYMGAMGKTGEYIGSRDLQALHGAIEGGDPAFKHLKADELYNLSEKPDPFRQIKVSNVPVTSLKSGVLAEVKSVGLLGKALQFAKSIVRRIPGLGAVVVGGVALYEYSNHTQDPEPSVMPTASPTRSFNPQAQAALDTAPAVRPSARPERKTDFGHN